MVGMIGGGAGSNLRGNAAGGNKIPSGYKYGQNQTYTPEQMNLFQNSFSQVSPDSYLSRLAGGDQSFYDEMEAPAMRQFAELQGQNASRFSGMGMGARRGSGFQNSMNSATSSFAQDLASRRQELQRQAIRDLMEMSHSLMGERPYQQYLMPKQEKQSSGWGGLLGGALGGVGGFFAGGPSGALAGANLGYNVGNSF
jgi:hypothetical protein